ncbi:hypothetical protein IXEL_52 [Microbacterium phage Ixel]|nr:hypothetical protein IXEL_52 [Microbacterium phage Ixel]
MDHITDKAVWSAVKAWYLTLSPGIAWENLTDEQRDQVRVEYLEHQERQPKSAHALRAELRSANIKIGILERKLAAANAKIAQFEASKALAAELARDEEGTCP